MHQRLLHFAVDSRWSDRDVRRQASRYALEAMTRRESVEAWIVDDTGFLKQGKHSVGVQRQDTGSAGKVANCQIGVSLSVATRTEHLPVDFELYLPACWANDEARRRFLGWHHHVSVALCCYAFLVAERTRRFPPPRPDGRLKPTRSHSRPERHFHDSFITARLAMARVIATWLPRCPTCHRSNHRRASRRLPGLPVHPSGP